VSKKYDPLWEIVDEKVALQGQESDVDVACPHCHVVVHLGNTAAVGERFACGLCAGTSVAISAGGSLALQKVEIED
jgi:Zn finger protein HypA/HybF involved in hydrogenase expression